MLWSHVELALKGWNEGMEWRIILKGPPLNVEKLNPRMGEYRIKYCIHRTVVLVTFPLMYVPHLCIHSLKNEAATSAASFFSAVIMIIWCLITPLLANFSSQFQKMVRLGEADIPLLSPHNSTFFCLSSLASRLLLSSAPKSHSLWMEIINAKWINQNTPRIWEGAGKLTVTGRKKWYLWQ